MTAVAADWIASLGHNGRVYVIPEFKVVFVSVAKNACTSMKWVMAELAREDINTFRSGLKPYTADEHAVHDRSQFKKALYPDQLDADMRREVHPDRGWFIFGIVRDPRARLFSAWQDKLLMQDPAYRSMQNQPWYPRIPRDAEEVASEFARFVDAASCEADFRLRKDTHFRPQTELLLWGHIPYSRVYPIRKLDELRVDLARHVERLGWTGPVRFRRSNDTALRANAMAYPDAVREKVEAMYSADFANFGDFWDFARISEAPAWTPAAIREVQVRGALGRRLGDVRAIALDHRRRARDALARAERLERELEAAKREAVRPSPASWSVAARRLLRGSTCKGRSFGRRRVAALRRYLAGR